MNNVHQARTGTCAEDLRQAPLQFESLVDRLLEALGRSDAGLSPTINALVAELDGVI